MLDGQLLKQEAVYCLKRGRPRWEEVSARLSAEIRWLCAQAGNQNCDPTKVIADFRVQFIGKTFPQTQWMELAPLVRQSFEVLTHQHFSHYRWNTRHDPDLLQSFPASELIALIDGGPAGWREKWTEHGGQRFAGRCIALLGDPVWSRYSDFGLPYPPFEWEGKLDVADVSVTESERLGLIAQQK